MGQQKVKRQKARCPIIVVRETATTSQARVVRETVTTSQIGVVREMVIVALGIGADVFKEL